MKRRKSIIWTISTEQLQKIVKGAASVSEILRHFALVSSGGSRRILVARMKESNIDYSHITPGKGRKKGQASKRIYTKKPLESVMVKNSTYDRGNLKTRLIKEKILNNECAICDCLPTWRGKALVLVLDHINGVNDDHRLENLRLLCPNCNSQQVTFCGGKKRRKNNCLNCGISMVRGRRYCENCHDEIIFEVDKEKCIDQRKSKRPPYNQLLQEINKTNYSAVGRKYGVSDNAIRKWVKYYEKYEQA